MNTKARAWKGRLSALFLASTILATTASTAVHAQRVPSKSKYGGEATVAINSTITGMCFTNINVGTNGGAIAAILEPLFLKAESGKAVGLLAVSATPSTDLKTWTIKLRSGISYSNGQAFNAESVIENIDYARGAKFLVNSAANLWTLSNGIPGSANILSLTKVDDLTVNFNLDRPQNDIDLALSYPTLGMRATEQLASANTCVNKAIGTGPFILDSWNADELIARKNPNYWRTDPNKPGTKLPYLDKITFINVKEGSQRAAAVRNGTADIAMFNGLLDGTFTKDLKQRKSAVSVTSTFANSYVSLWMNQGNGGPFADLNARLAVASCIDRVNFNKVRVKGTGEVPTSTVGSKSVMYNKKGLVPFNVKKAKGYVAAYLAANPGKTSLAFTLPFEPSTSSQANRNFLKSTFASCNITLNDTTEEGNVWVSKAFNPLTGKNAYDAIYVPLLLDVDVAVNFQFLVSNMFPTDSKNPLKMFRSALGVVNNPTKHSNTKLDDMLWAARAATTPAAMKAAYALAMQEIQEQAVFVPVVNIGTSVALSKKTKITGLGSLQLVKGVKSRVISNVGADWAGIYKG
jgi:ABC-type transport system substrate-binding protein